MTTKDRNQLEPWQLEDAERLRHLFKLHAKVSQLKFGAEHDIGTQGAVWQFLHGERPLNLRVALKFAKGLGVRVSDFSPRLADELPDKLDNPAAALSQILQDLPAGTGQLTLDFLRLQVERSSELFAREKTAKYLAWIDEITADLQRRKNEDDNHEGSN